MFPNREFGRGSADGARGRRHRHGWRWIERERRGRRERRIPMVGEVSTAWWLAGDTKVTRRLLLPIAVSPMRSTLKERP